MSDQFDALRSSANNEWGTTLHIFNPLNEEFKFTVGACGSERNHLLPRYWTIEQNGLVQDWTGEVVWCNPPFEVQRNFTRGLDTGYDKE